MHENTHTQHIHSYKCLWIVSGYRVPRKQRFLSRFDSNKSPNHSNSSSCFPIWARVEYKKEGAGVSLVVERKHRP